MDKNPVLLSICCITYNHENYISQAIEGFLAQKTSFNFEIIIHDDASTDATASIVKKYEQEHPNLIKAIYQKENQYSQGIKPWPNFVFPIARGKYIALCEGDDYWTDPYKLQKQVDFLEANPEYILCFTNTRTVDENNQILRPKVIESCTKDTFDHSDMPLFAPTLTRVFRNLHISEMPLPQNTPGGDTYMLVWQSKFGKIKYIDEVTSSYRIHPNGVWSSLSSKQKELNHLFLTRMGCIPIVQRELLPKFFRLLFDLALRSTNASEVRKKTKEIRTSAQKRRNDLPKSKYTLIIFLALYLSIPRLHHYNLFFRLKYKLLERLYKNAS